MTQSRLLALKIATVVVCFATLLVAIRLWYLEEQGNFHPITVGEAYRSAQLDRDELEHYIRNFRIGSFINLRGENVGEPWYDEEIATCRNLDVNHFDLNLSAEKAPTSSQVQALLNVFRAAPRPVLIHCRAGADRSGLASAIWKVVIDGESASSASRQLSILFGHMPFGATQVLDDFFKAWASDLRVEDVRFERTEYALD